MLRAFRCRSAQLRCARFEFDNDFYYTPSPTREELSFEEYMSMLESINQKNVKMYARITRSVELIDLERTKDQFRLIGRRYGKVVKINKDANLPSHGFISNQQSNPVIYFNDESTNFDAIDFGYYKYDLIRDKNGQYRAINLTRLSFFETDITDETDISLQKPSAELEKSNSENTNELPSNDGSEIKVTEQEILNVSSESDRSDG